MQYLKADTVTEVLIGPVVAVGDGFTPVTTLTIAGADEAEIIKHGATTVTAITGTLAAITSADGYYALDLVTGDVDTEGRLTILINDDSLCLPVRHDFMVVNANVFDSLFAAATTDYLQIDTTQWLGTACATPTVNGVPEVDLTHVAGATTNVSALATNVDAILTDTGTTLDTAITAIKTKTDYLPSATAGAAGGVFIAGSNAATTFATLTVTGATTFTGNVAYSNGITITQATLNGHGISITGNGTGSGVNSVGGATGMGGNFQGGSTSGIGLRCYSTGAATTYSGFHAEATATNGSGMRLVGAGTGSGLLLEPGASGYGVNGSIQGDLSGSVGSVTGAVGSVTGDVGGNVVGSLGSLVANAINNNSIHSNACAKISDSGIQRGASNWENNSDDRSLAWAISKLVNKVDLNAAGDTLSIRKSNDSTALFTQAVTTSGGAAPVVSLDTTG